MTAVTIPTFHDVVREAMTSTVLADMAKADALRADRSVWPPKRWLSTTSLMTTRGTAGKALDWWGAVGSSLDPESMVEAFAERCDHEVEKSPHWFTKRHLLRLIEVAGRMAEKAVL